MNYLETLLQGERVQWKTLGEVVKTITAPTKVKRKAYQKTGKTPIIDQGIEFIAGYTDKPLTPVKLGEYVIFGDHSEHIKYVDFEFIQGADGLKILKTKSDNTKYIYYAFINFYRKESNYKRHWTTAKETLIPIPSLPIQKEIVRMLDAFTTLIAELTKELTARQNQYTYYRDKLLTFEEGEAEWKTLGEVGEFQRGKRFVKTDMISEGVPCIHYGEMYTHYGIWAEESKSFISKELVESKKLRVAENGDVVIVAAGETIEDLGRGTAWLGSEEVVVHDACFTYKSSLNPKYVAYFTRTKYFHNQIRKYISSGKISAINSRGLERTTIPIPPLSEQARIVSILDKFDRLVHSISEGLPKEIALRQQQYEYYRDTLLDFGRAESDAR